jgi:prevent-host-death family protein
MEINIHEAKTHFSKLLKKVAEGEEVTISRAGVPVAKLVGIGSPRAARPLGTLEGQIWIADDFDAPLSDEDLALFYGEEPERKKPVRVKAAKVTRRHARP